MRNVTLRQLRSIIEIAHAGKIVSAAKVLRLTPSAVTLQLQALEAELGASLFDRDQDGMRPTDAGRLAIDAAHAIEENLRELRERIDEVKGVRRGSLRLGVVSTAKYFAPRIMAAFMRDYAGLDVELQVGNREEVIAALTDYAIDIALMGRPPKSIAVRAKVFGDHPLVIIAAPGHPLAGRRDISRERIAAEPFLVRERGSGTRISLEIYFSGIPGKLDFVGREMGSNETIKQAVMAGLGIAFISAHTIAAEVETGRLIMLDVEGTPIRRQWYSVSRADRHETPAMAAFATFLATKGAQHLPLVPPLYRATHV